MIRPLTIADLSAALRLSDAAGWNQTGRDWNRLFLLSNCFGVFVDGQLVASVSVTCYGNDLAWIGMVLTLPDHRGKGYASQLMTRAMDFALGESIRCIKLDATELGIPVYRKFGFVEECAVERWRSSGGPGIVVPQAAEIEWKIDRKAFGADRRSLIESFDDVMGADSSYACRRGGRTSAQFGPCVATDAATARELALWGCAQGPTFWDLFPGSFRAVEIAHQLGFTPARKLLRMSYQGVDIEQDPAMVYALAGFEWG